MKKTVKNTAFIGACLIGLFITNKVYAASLAIEDGQTGAGDVNGSLNVKLIDNDQILKLSDVKKITFKIDTSDSSHVTGIDFRYDYAGASFTKSADGSTYTIETADVFRADKIGTVSFKTTSDLTSDFQIMPVELHMYKADGTEAEAGVKAISGNVKFQAPKSNVAELSSLSISQGSLTPEFNKDTLEYKVQISDTLRSIRINATANERGTVSGTGVKSNLQNGENNFDITVTSEDGSNSKTYKITVIKGNIPEPSAYLKSLDINNIGVELSPEFDSKNNKYTVTVGEEIDSLNFKYETEDPLAVVTITGNEKFELGENIVTIKVESSGDTPLEQEYEITVIKEMEESAEESIEDNAEANKPKKLNVWLIVGIVAGILLIVGGVTFVLFKKKKKNNKKNDKGDGKPPIKTKKHSLMEDDEYEDDDEEEKTDEEKSLLDEYTSEDTEPLESTITLNRTSRLAKRDESVTDILKGELFEDEKTRQFDSHSFREIIDDRDDEDDKTKEFDFRDFE